MTVLGCVLNRHPATNDVVSAHHTTPPPRSQLHVFSPPSPSIVALGLLGGLLGEMDEWMDLYVSK